MFSGIVEATSVIIGAVTRGAVIRAVVEKPISFDDLKTGDSVSVDGVCLTVEDVDAEAIMFAIGPETQKVTGWILSNVIGRVINLERSLRLNDRIHGHLVTGHVDTLGNVEDIQRQEGSQVMQIAFPEAVRPYIWPKGSITVNGVSLTINQVTAGSFSVGLIPETLKRTNLGTLAPGHSVNLEVDNNARGLVHWLRQSNGLKEY